MGRMELDYLLQDPSALGLRGICHVGDTYHLDREATTPVAACPGCGTWPVRVHGRYTRHPDNLVVSGYCVRLELRVCKFFCSAPGCARSSFCERLPAMLAACTRRTLPLAQVLTYRSLLVSANVVRRLGMVLALRGSASGFLRLAHAQVPTCSTTTAVGVDDFAFCRGRRYGTLVIDLQTHRPVDVLVGRSLDLRRDYLQEHSEIMAIARDRDTSCAEAIRWAAPQAQVGLDR